MNSRLVLMLAMLVSPKAVLAEEIVSMFEISLAKVHVGTTAKSPFANAASSMLQQFPLQSLVELFSQLPKVESVKALHESGSQKLVDRGDYREVVRQFPILVTLVDGSQINFVAHETFRRCYVDSPCELRSSVTLTSASGESISTDIKLNLNNKIIVDSWVQLPNQISEAIVNVFSTNKDLTRAQWLRVLAEHLGANNKKLVGELVLQRASR